MCDLSACGERRKVTVQHCSQIGGVWTACFHSDRIHISSIHGNNYVYFPQSYWFPFNILIIIIASICDRISIVNQSTILSTSIQTTTFSATCSVCCRPHVLSIECIYEQWTMNISRRYDHEIIFRLFLKHTAVFRQHFHYFGDITCFVWATCANTCLSAVNKRFIVRNAGINN